MGEDTFEFLVTIDKTRRKLLLAQLGLGQVLDVLRKLDCGLPGKRARKTQLAALEAVLAEYKIHKRLLTGAKSSKSPATTGASNLAVRPPQYLTEGIHQAPTSHRVSP